MVSNRPGSHQKTIAANKGYDTMGCANSIQARRGVETVLGWIQQFRGLRQFKWQSRDQVSAVFDLHVMAYNLIRLSTSLRPAVEVV